MQPWDAYLIHNALKLHFTTDSYDVVKYNFKTSARQKSFLARKDKYFFARVAKQYPEKQQLVEFFVANFVKWGSLNTFGPRENQYDETYKEWTRRMDSLTYTFGQEMDKLNEYCMKNRISFDALLIPVGNAVPLLRLWSEETISLETIVILDILTDFMSQANERVSETILWPEFYRKVHKYRPFMKIDRKKFRAIVLSRFTS